MTQDPYVDPATGVLRNLLGLTTAAELATAEADITFAADVSLIDSPEPGAFDLAHLCRIHRRLFGDIYGWAGEVRTVGIDKGAPFAHPQFIEEQSAMIFRHLAEERYLVGLPREQFVDRLTHFLSDVNALHPFRDGNGRAQRAFFRHLAAEAGWHLDWTGVTAEENVAASASSLVGDLEPLRRLLDRVVRPLE
ncbi:MAG TPA: Fic family protein [Egibacteraceae bacterium]|nr:Fic family protein [Egibacteraceae bacterium]